MTCGIYCIENLETNKKYIGKSKNMEYRFANHKQALKMNRHKNIYLQRSYNIYGLEKFSFNILEECAENELNEKEIFFIRKFSSMIPYGYNISEGGQGVSGYTHNEERRKKIKENTPKMAGKNHWNFGKKAKLETLKKMRDAVLMDKSPVFGTKHENSASKFFGVSIHHHRQVIRGKEYKTLYWRAKLRVDKKEYTLGYFRDEISAAKAYDAFVIKNNLKNPLNFPIL